MTEREIIRTIRTRREQLGMTQGQAAKLAGMLRQAYNRVESGRNSPNLSTLTGICRSLGLEVSVKPIQSNDR